MTLFNSYVLSALSGAVWGFFAMLVTGVTLTLVSGELAVPQISAAVLASAIGAMLYHHWDGKAASLGQRAMPALVVALVLLAATFGAPFSLPLDIEPMLQAIALTVFVGGIVLANRLTLKDTVKGVLTRYEKEVIFLRVAKGVGFIIFSIMVALPFYVMVMTSLKSQQQLIANPLDLSIDLSGGLESVFRSYVELFTKFNFGTYLLVSAIVSVSTVLITLLFSVPGAYAVSRLNFPGRAWFSRSVLLIYMVPAIVLVIPLYAVFSQLGLRNSLTGLLIVYPATTIPVALYMLQGYFKGLPAELEEAGLMDGLSRIGVIMKITLPLSLPALASVSLYVFMIAWNEFLFAFMFLDDPDIFTLSRGVVSLNSSEVPRQHLMAGAVIATVPVLCLFLWFERFLVQGLTAGSVKG